MPSIVFDQVSKSFGDTPVIADFHAEVPDRDFLVLLGPSGCGKSTMLRMIAGITELSSGEIRFDDRVVNDLTPRQRNIAFVFQSYALYPHMTVRANIGFPLVMDRARWWHHVPVLGGLARRAILRSPEVSARIEEVAATLELTGYLDRRPKALSGGQRQRVALARSLVREPDVYLLDEPLSNLDAKLRTQMRAEISALHARVGKTFVYVTHDQVEAMTMGTRIVVLNDGVVQQYGEPREIYERPANEFVARFIGSPPMNLVDAKVDDGRLRVGGVAVPGTTGAAAALTAQGRTTIRMGVRAERIRVDPAERATGDGLAARVTTVEHLGAETIVGFRLDGDTAPEEPLLARMPGDVRLDPGAPCHVHLDTTGAGWFAPETGVRVEL
ncbi:Glycerol-3-phosphate ABC transporter, ATP-binding protein UgpC [Pseudonocardia sp. Ae168_Ps1]|uniref:ABC transporter ATP-binding protein n=1 Tax=unclassified Pseudonocardia TaxID=2619320 RepID=UPI00094AAC11|nr:MULTISPECIES: ABC transporter ATP-binding protein [unclassified Pseudonocardia]OLL72419.1 Glycerol-3-phosphate ABC transporter, ATP-binding protein UgpC [Pseudonocardia sp. Ae150A_Ps1]OLL78391.1 Glycerol-3-phosphate ABC transporter, ATP-binding protein UgpC [Pseudonocardia sp. Ae168_Ps1]OLL87483.1 Glycerol-3-phosphate ABC transporter, ATP-binding protein UgpC [Pseudonocardia sp. Ae263_Ps1]OLL92488.1 Glycerol-3-phosphate ABC transporter, ATP-binding protein UgpC [Pseudonocardia sp. Ae356_Ps1]